MTWYAVYGLSTGELISVGQVVDPAKLPEGVAFAALEAAPDPASQTWDPAARAFVGKSDAQVAADIERGLVSLYEEWKRWADTVAAATAKGKSGTALTKLSIRESAAFDAYWAGLVEWYSRYGA